MVISLPEQETTEEIEQEMEEGEKEETVYTKEGREKLMEDAEVTDWEEGFMEGAEDDGEQGKCANCGGMLLEDNTVEKEIKGKMKWFCSDKCVEDYEKKHTKE